MLKKQKAGLSTAAVCRKHGVSAATLYKDKARFGGLEVSDARRLKALEDENANQKKLLAEAMLDNAILMDCHAAKVAAPGGKREAVAHVMAVHGVSQVGTPRQRQISRACAIAACGQTMPMQGLR